MENLCSICHEERTNPHQLECGHEFCSSCIVHWFRNDNRSCPLCRDEPLMNITRIDAHERAKVIVQRAKRKDASRLLKLSVQRVRDKKMKAKQLRQKCSALRRQHRDVLREVSKATSHYLRASRNARQAERELGYKVFHDDEPLISDVVSTTGYSFSRRML